MLTIMKWWFLVDEQRNNMYLTLLTTTHKVLVNRTLKNNMTEEVGSTWNLYKPNILMCIGSTGFIIID